MTGTKCELFTHNQSRSYLNHFVVHSIVLICLLSDCCVLLGMLVYVC